MVMGRNTFYELIMLVNDRIYIVKRMGSFNKNFEVGFLFWDMEEHLYQCLGELPHYNLTEILF